MACAGHRAAWCAGRHFLSLVRPSDQPRVGVFLRQLVRAYQILSCDFVWIELDDGDAQWLLRGVALRHGGVLLRLSRRSDSSVLHPPMQTPDVIRCSSGGRRP